MSNTAESRKAEYDQALSLANNGETDAALDILWGLRLKVDLSIYRRALVNITLASLLQRADRDKYAQECLDLLDLLRQQHADRTDIDEELEHIADMESAAREILQYNPWLTDNTPLIDPHPITDLLSNTGVPLQASPTKDVAADMQNQSSPNNYSASQDNGEVVWESDYIPLESASANLPQVEGFLRDEHYTPLTEGRDPKAAPPTSKPTTEDKPRAQTPSSSPP